MGNAYVEMLSADRDYLMLQHQAYSACDDELIRDRVRGCYGVSSRSSSASRAPTRSASMTSSVVECG